MGLIALTDDTDVPFPRRLFAALADIEIKNGKYAECWYDMKNRFEGSGSFLDLSELTDDEVVALRVGVNSLLRQISGSSSFAGFDVSGIEKSLNAVKNHLQN